MLTLTVCKLSNYTIHRVLNLFGTHLSVTFFIQWVNITEFPIGPFPKSQIEICVQSRRKYFIFLCIIKWATVAGSLSCGRYLRRVPKSKTFHRPGTYPTTFTEIVGIPNDYGVDVRTNNISVYVLPNPLLQYIVPHSDTNILKNISLSENVFSHLKIEPIFLTPTHPLK